MENPYNEFEQVEEYLKLQEKLESKTKSAERIVEEFIPEDRIERYYYRKLEAETELVAIKNKIAQLKESISLSVIAKGETLDHEQLQVVYYKGKSEWDTASLDVYAVNNPQIATFKRLWDTKALDKYVQSNKELEPFMTKGTPYVQFRQKK